MPYACYTAASAHTSAVIANSTASCVHAHNNSLLLYPYLHLHTHSDAATALVSDEATTTPEQAAALAAAAQRAAAAEELVRHRVWFWSAILPRCDHYVLRWESTMLVELGRSVEKLLRDAGMKAFQEGLKYTALATLMAGQ
jgi:Protein of unknown function (DUF726)